MNWEVFSTAGYASVALWLLVPVLWLVHLLWRPRRWLAHTAIGVGVIALVLARYNSKAYVSLIQVDYDDQVEEQMSRQELARRAAENERAGEVAQIRFAEDGSGDFFDTAGLDDSDYEYFESNEIGQEPAWKKQKRERSTQAPASDDLESQIGASREQQGVEVSDVFEQQVDDPIKMSDADKLTADRLDRANLTATRWVLGLAVLFVLVDYVKRLNSYRESYFPLPVPSAWADGLTPRPTVFTRPDKPRRSMRDELKTIARRGETFIYLSDDASTADRALTPMPRLPLGLWNVRVLDAGSDQKFDADFVFESLWFARNCFVVKDPERFSSMLDRFAVLLEQRRESRAHTKRTVHIVWDGVTPIPEQTLKRLSAAAQATGWTLLINPRPEPTEAHA